MLPVAMAVLDFGKGCFSFIFFRAMAATLTYLTYKALIQPILPNITLNSGKQQVLPVFVTVLDFGEGCFNLVFSRAMARAYLLT